MEVLSHTMQFCDLKKCTQYFRKDDVKFQQLKIKALQTRNFINQSQYKNKGRDAWKVTRKKQYQEMLKKVQE